MQLVLVTLEALLRHVSIYQDVFLGYGIILYSNLTRMKPITFGVSTRAKLQGM